MQKANAKEIYVASLVLLIGVIYLAAQVDALFAIGSTRVKGDVIHLSKNEMLSHFRSMFTIVFCFSGGILLLKTKTSGWVISQSILLLLTAIASGIYASNMSGLNFSGIILITGILMLLLAIIFLTLPQTRRRFMISKRSYLSAIILFTVLAVFYFLLQ